MESKERESANSVLNTTDPFKGKKYFKKLI